LELFKKFDFQDLSLTLDWIFSIQYFVRMGKISMMGKIELNFTVYSDKHWDWYWISNHKNLTMGYTWQELDGIM
jgi:hypothetical protein